VTFFALATPAGDIGTFLKNQNIKAGASQNQRAHAAAGARADDAKIRPQALAAGQVFPYFAARHDLVRHFIPQSD
jgi:hypothetical protein